MNKKLILGISGGIAAYKIPELVRALIKDQFKVRCVLTEHATHFVAPLSLATVSGEPPLYNQFIEPEKITHIDLARNSDMFVVAPATANVIAKFAHGIADDLLSTLFLSFNGTKLIVPAMNTNMYLNPITQENIKKLQDIGVHFLGPDTGELACGDEGIGRMVDLDLIIKKIKSLCYKPIQLKGKRILVTAGGTSEPLDPVRMITNKSTGKMGLALANTATFWGAQVTLITTKPLPENNPLIKSVIYVNTVEQMNQAVTQQIKKNDYLFMAAAVSDFTCPKSSQKLARAHKLQLNLVGTTDILKSIASLKKGKTYVGFCLADEHLEKVAQKKLVEKKLDYIVANTSNVIGQEKRTIALLSAKTKKVTYFKEESLEALSHHLLEKICIP